MVDTRIGNNSMNTKCMSTGTPTSSSRNVESHNSYVDSPMLEEQSPINIWQSGHHPAQIPVVSVKEEPMDIEHNSHSPNNDSGISPGHGSSGSSAGRPSPGQNGTFRSSEHFNTQDNQGLNSELSNGTNIATNQLTPYNNHHNKGSMLTPIWGINILQNPHGQQIAPSSITSNRLENSALQNSPSKAVTKSSLCNTDYPLQKTPPSANHINQNCTPNTSPLSTSSSLQTVVTAAANRSPVMNQNIASPSNLMQRPISSSPVAVLSQNQTAPIPDTNAPPGLNASISDDNNSQSSSASSSSTSMLDGENGYFKMTSSQGQMEEQNPLRCLEMAVEQSPIMGGMRNDGITGAGNNGVRNIYQCPLCDYNTLSRIDFNNHNATHCPDHKCSKCDFITKDFGKLQAHLREHHDVSPRLAEEILEAKEEQPGIRVPRVNSQGKVKTFRCKQCTYVAITKLEFWNHSRMHIRKEKMLNCPRCPFVTEYKHHLEYHLRNHVNSKPFQCCKCDYSCVNKSMLNSHLKSHSTVYQYRCASCNYATKYCHSLKLHLRKYCHSPAMVLNPDGTPNPHPIIDVYGTRRGPKQRPRNIMKSEEKHMDVPAPSHAPLPLSLFQGSYGMISQQSGELPVSYPYASIIPNAFPTNNNSMLSTFPQSGIINTKERNSDALDAQKNLPEENCDHFLSPLSQYYHLNNNNIISDSSSLKEMPTERPDQEENSDESHFHKEAIGEQRQSVKNKISSSPLDLSRPDVTEVRSPTSVQQKSPSTVKTSTKHRRKGKACKLDHIAWRLQQRDPEEEEVNRNCNVSGNKEKLNSPEKLDNNLINTESTQEQKTLENKISLSDVRKMNEDYKKIETGNKGSVEKNSVSGGNSKLYHCSYCDITFSDAVLYTMHKGYHGFQDPFKCNMCGEQTADKVEFFLHIARSSHC